MSSSAHALYTLPALETSGNGRVSPVEPVVRTWTITSVYGEGSPLEITVQAQVTAAGGLRERDTNERVLHHASEFDETWPSTSA